MAASWQHLIGEVSAAFYRFLWASICNLSLKASKFNFLIVPQKEESLKPIIVAEREGEIERESSLQGFRTTLGHARISSNGPSHRTLLSSDLGNDWG